jgi:hypothetical protein
MWIVQGEIKLMMVVRDGKWMVGVLAIYEKW